MGVKFLDTSESSGLNGVELVDIPKTENIKRVCIDGRYDIEGVPSYPGGEAGKVIAINKALVDSGLSTRRRKTILKKYINKEFPEGLPYHGANGYVCDADKCGHYNEVKTNPKKYGVTPEDINLFERFIKKYPDDKVTDLQGKHEEKGAIIISSEDKTVNSREEGRDDYFVFNEGIEKDQNKKVVEELGRIGNLTKKVKERINKKLDNTDKDHFEKTIEALAPELPVYYEKNGNFTKKERENKDD